MRRVVVTGLGLVTPIGVGVKFAWPSLLAGKSGVRLLRDPVYEQLNIPCRIAALVPEGKDPGCFDKDAFSRQEWKSLSRAMAFALVATEEALQDADLSVLLRNEQERANTGVAVGIGVTELEEVCATGQTLFGQGYNKLSPYFVPKILTNMAAGQISIRYGFRGPNHSVSTACTTGTHAVGDAFSFIRHKKADVMVCGASEACVNPVAMSGFCRMRALSTKFNHEPTKASRPFDSGRDGFVMGEGAGIMILESFEHAVARKARIYAEILGYGLSGDAVHLTAPDSGGIGALLSMQRALDDANHGPDQIGFVNAHATSTPLGDNVECIALNKLFSSQSGCVKPFLTATKGSTGHLLAAAGAVECIFTTLSCYTGWLPPTANFTESEIDFGQMVLVTKDSGSKWSDKRRIALKNSFGFGGTNASLCICN